jgi:hypothetical protein
MTDRRLLILLGVLALALLITIIVAVVMESTPEFPPIPIPTVSRA